MGIRKFKTNDTEDGTPFKGISYVGGRLFDRISYEATTGFFSIEVTYQAGETSATVPYVSSNFKVIRANASVDNYLKGANIVISFNSGEKIRIEFNTETTSRFQLSSFGASTNKQALVKLLNVGDVRGMDNMFYGSHMTSFECLADLSEIFDFYGTWNNCTSLTSFPAVDTSGGSNFRYTFDGCSSMICMGGLDTTHATNKTGMFTGTGAMVHPSAAEISDMIDANGAVYTYGGC